MPDTKTPGPIPKAALKFLRTKKLKPSFDYRDIWKQEHAHAFTIAKAMKKDILIDIKLHLEDALENGTTFAQFQKDLTPLLQVKGWWGIKEMKDPLTGKMVEVQLGSPRRLKTIFDSNLRTARAAGQWDRIQRTKRALPYLIYELGPSLEHRKQHEKWAGFIGAVDDPIWRILFTPNGYGCKCRIRQVSQREKDRLMKTGKYTDKTPKLEYMDWENKRTGEIEKVPVGIDPGWDVNPGFDREGIIKKKAKRADIEFEQVVKAKPKPKPKIDKKPSAPAVIPSSFSTDKAVNAEAINEVLSSLESAAPQLKKLQEFTNKRDIKTVFVSQSEMSSRNRASEKIVNDVTDYLGGESKSNYKFNYTISRPTRVGGFTHIKFNHIVVKRGAKSKIYTKNAEKIKADLLDSVSNVFKKGDLWGVAEGAKLPSSQMISIWLHEVGHQIHYWASSPKKPEGVTNWTRYSKTNHYEYHAEHFVLWLLDRDAFYKSDPQATVHFDNLIDTAIKSKIKKR